MSSVELLQPVPGGLQRNNFFNGRLLSAEDLLAEQDADRTSAGRLARAIGDGVASGLDVSISTASPQRPTVIVSKGLAINRCGDLLALADDTELALVPTTEPDDVAAGVFRQCEPPRATADPLGTGAYVLVVSPTSGYSGRALVSDPNATALGRGKCGARFVVEYVQFRLVPMPLTALGGIPAGLLPPTGDKARERLRNVLAHVCFGTQKLLRRLADPGATDGTHSAWDGDGAIPAMRARGDLTDCDVPLAVVVLTQDGISLVDMWAVRRRLLDAGAVDAWRGVAGPWRVAESEAAYLQFQSQLEIVARAATPATVAADEWFDFLPAGGMLPAGFDWATFLGPHAPPSVTEVDASLLRGIVEQSWFGEPFATSQDPPVPLRVFRQPGADYSVFARSSDGNVRVIFTPEPAPTDHIYVRAISAHGPSFRAETRVGDTAPIANLAPGAYRVVVASRDYQRVAPISIGVVGGRTVDVGVALAPLPNGSILVHAVDQAGAPLGDNVDAITASGGGRTGTAELQFSGDWLVPNLLPGTYALTGTAPGFKTAALAGVGPVAPNVQVPATLVFEKLAVDTGPPKPPLCVDFRPLSVFRTKRVRLCMVLAATEFDRRRFDEGTLKDIETRSGTKFAIAGRRETWKEDKKSGRFASSGGAILYDAPPWDAWPVLRPEPEEVSQWLKDWAEWLSGAFADRSSFEARPVVRLSPLLAKGREQAPRGIADGPLSSATPLAYAVFGGFGIPLEVKLSDAAPRAIDLDGSKVEISQSLLEKLRAVDIARVDGLAWAWGELIEDATGLDPTRAGNLIVRAARVQLEQI